MELKLPSFSLEPVPSDGEMSFEGLKVDREPVGLCIWNFELLVPPMFFESLLIRIKLVGEILLYESSSSARLSLLLYWAPTQACLTGAN